VTVPSLWPTRPPRLDHPETVPPRGIAGCDIAAVASHEAAQGDASVNIAGRMASSDSPRVGADEATQVGIACHIAAGCVAGCDCPVAASYEASAEDESPDMPARHVATGQLPLSQVADQRAHRLALCCVYIRVIQTEVSDGRVGIVHDTEQADVVSARRYVAEIRDDVVVAIEDARKGELASTPMMLKSVSA